jgi:predicted nucleotidyltransferase component of viral defense system
LVRLAEEYCFLKNTCEKVLRLADVLDYLSKSKVKDCLALKGGTAINLFLLNLPRLSVDADFDFTLECSRKEMLEKNLGKTDHNGLFPFVSLFHQSENKIGGLFRFLCLQLPNALILARCAEN